MDAEVEPVEFRILVTTSGVDWSGPCQVMIGLPESYSIPFVAKMAAAEYLSYIVATESNAGFERALELITEGAMTWRHQFRSGMHNQGER